ncbi:MAG TPA: type II toxin-antitoxin system Phd/YefM family antitoxin [Verrucomicrobiales bacterium]|nr:type II toxin-antitoxin system Phd/YefM family antitoxin [Verrucomicrobiales bacterium]
MIVKATQLRKDIYSILDQVLETGKPVQVERNGRTLTIQPDVRPPKLDRLKKRKVLTGDPDSVVRVDWSGEWKNDLP